jgi:hypothetical protein
MPIPVAPLPVASGLPIYRLPGLPDFNADDLTLIVSSFDGLRARSRPDLELVANGGGPGAVLTGSAQPSEQLLTLSGVILCADRAELHAMRRLLLAALPFGQLVPLGIIDDAAGIDLQLFVALYDQETIEFRGPYLYFTFPLVAPDPFRYATGPLAGDVGVFTGQQWYRSYADDGSGTWISIYDAGVNRSYAQSEPSGPYPQSLSLVSDGDGPSARVTVTVSGPLAAGDWWLLNETTGKRLWADLSILEDQQLTFDMAAHTAFLNGADVAHLVYGDWLSLEPGTNTYRLVAGTQSSAFAHIEALEAYQ